MPNRSRLLRTVLLASLACVVACGGGRVEPLAGEVADPATRRDLAGGPVIGFAHPEGGHAWLGIPFAQPPVGDLRWRAPRAPEPVTAPREALDFGSPCMQIASPLGARDGTPSGEPTGSEDCLYLNVFAPAFTPDAVPTGDARLPVMVWIHGGGNSIGDASPYDGSTLAIQGGVIVVTVHYRLGFFGWFSHSALRPEGTSLDDASGNYGTLDLVRALEWVRDEIAFFGGDPDRVTIFGESAGGSDVYSLLLSPRAAGLFHRGIAQSGSVRSTPRSEAEHAVDAAEPGAPGSSGEVLLSLLQADGTASDRGGAKQAVAGMSADAVETYLRGQPAEALLATVGEGFGGMYRAPEIIRDGHVVLTGDPMEHLAAGRYNRVPFMSGTNRDEQKLFMLFGSEHVSRMLGIPLRIREPRLYDLHAEYGAKDWKARAVDEPLARMRPVQGPTVFGYRWDWDDEGRLLWLDLGRMLGAAHALEIPFVFGRLGLFTDLIFDEDRRELDQELSDAMVSYWTSFAATGDPGRGRDDSLPSWPAWSAGEGPKYLVLDSADDGGIHTSTDTVESAGLLDALATDPRFENPGERCAVLADFVRFGATLSAERYRTGWDGLCAAHPIDPAP